ncbi:MAG: SNF2-related protein, partial [Myxococcota bacterium]
MEALRSRSDRVTLPDGTEGVIGATEARRLRALAGLGQSRQGRLRFARSQAILLEALVSTGAQVERDEEFRRVVADLQGDLTISPAEEPSDFGGKLRVYQKFGLGWLLVLRRLGLGGCLADDMGLGKTVQVLALLSTIRKRAESEGTRLAPTLVVAPRSLVFNWRQEAERFTPDLRVVEYTGQQRTTQLEAIHEAHVILTTYGTLRRDVDLLAGLAFDYVILDEAQTIKNHAAQVSKASRALTARHRLALSGTPVENDVSELWSIFEFLNPKMLGSRRDFVRMAQGDALPLVARGLAPLLLRRRKEDVLRELPEKTELTVYCDLRPEERQAYDALRRRYRDEIDSKAAKSGTAALRTDVVSLPLLGPEVAVDGELRLFRKLT